MRQRRAPFPTPLRSPFLGLSLRPSLVAALLALPLSQLGHALAYGFHFGRAAVPRQTTGAHAYFPALAGSAALLLAGVLLACLLLLGLARRLVTLRGAPKLSTAWPWLPLATAMLGIQLGIFSGQELAEGVPLAPAVLFFGLLGQVPVALAGALALAWLSIRVLRAARALGGAHIRVAAVPARSAGRLPAGSPVLIRRAAFSVSHPRRGPPRPPKTRD